MALIDFTMSNARQVYSSVGDPLGGKGLTTSKAKTISPHQCVIPLWHGTTVSFETKMWNKGQVSLLQSCWSQDQTIKSLWQTVQMVGDHKLRNLESVVCWHYWSSLILVLVWTAWNWAVRAAKSEAHHVPVMPWFTPYLCHSNITGESSFNLYPQ